MTGPTDDLRIDRGAAVERRDLAEGAWVDLVPGFARQPSEAMAELTDTLPWQQSEILRYDRYVPEKRLTAGVDADSHPLLRQTALHLRSRYRVAFTGVAALLYRNGDDFQGLHSDRELRWLDDTLIAILVLGERRPFVLRPRQERGVPVERIPSGRGPDDVILTPGEGDLLVMGGASQRTWLHGIPAVPGHGDPRISLTWRWTSRTGRPDTNPSYYDGRQFGDAPRRSGYRMRPRDS